MKISICCAGCCFHHPNKQTKKWRFSWKKIICRLSTVDTIVAFVDVTEVGEVRPEEFGTVDAWIGFAQNDQ